MGAHIAIAKGEPDRLDAVRGQPRPPPPVFILTSPTAYRISPPTEGVHDRVEVRADPQTVQGDVIRSIGDHRDFCGGVGPAYTEREFRAADTTGQDHDLHRTSVPQYVFCSRGA